MVTITKPERALVHSEKARALAGTRPLIVASHAHVLARNGRRQEALKALDDLYALAKPRGPRPFSWPWFMQVCKTRIARSSGWTKQWKRGTRKSSS